MYVLSLMGVGEIAGSPLMGPIRDKFGTRIAVFVQFILTSVGFTLLLIFNYTNRFNALPYFVMFFWGL